MDHRDDQSPPTDQRTDPGKARGQSDTTTEQRGDIEAGTTTGKASDRPAGSQFAGSRSATDTSGELIEDEDFARDGQGAPE